MTSLLRSQTVRTAAAGTFVLSVLGLAVCSMPSVQAATQKARSGEILTYASPVEMLYSPDGTRLFVLCQGSDEVRVLNSGFQTIRQIPVGHIPRGLAFSADARRLYVANTWDDTLSVIDTRLLKVTDTWTVTAEPSGVAADRAGKYVFVANRISNDVAVLDATSGAELKRLAAGRGASYITASPNRARLYVTHIYPNPPRESTAEGNRAAPQAEITVVDAARATVVDRIRLADVAHGFHIAFSRDGKLGVVAQLHPKNLVPLAHLEHSGAFADTLTLFGADVGRPVEVPLDELERYATRPFGVAISPDRSHVYVTSGGAEFVSVIDVPRMVQYARRHPGSTARDLGASANYVVTRIAVGRDPRGIAFTPDGSRLLVANRLDDTISVIETRTNRVVRTVALEKAKVITVLRHGEQTFYTARYSFQGQIGCANCHIDSTFDGLTWDLEPDGFGRDIVDNRLLEDIRGTEPFKWNGGNPNLPTECGPRTEKYFWRSENYDDLTLTDLVVYVRHLPLRPNRWRQADGSLTPAQDRGKQLFNRSMDKFGIAIAEGNRCSYCHSGPKGTSQRSFDVGTGKRTDNSGLLDTPQLINVGLTAPYLHDGSAKTLEEIWTVFNPEDKHGRTNDLTKDELNDLVEYLRTR